MAGYYRPIPGHQRRGRRTYKREPRQVQAPTGLVDRGRGGGGGGGGIPMGGSSTTTGPAPQFAEQSGGLSGGIEGLMGMKEGYDQVTNAKKAKEGVKEWYGNPGEGQMLSPAERVQDVGTQFQNMFTEPDITSRNLNPLTNAERGINTYNAMSEGMGDAAFSGFNAQNPQLAPQVMRNNSQLANMQAISGAGGAEAAASLNAATNAGAKTSFGLQQGGQLFDSGMKGVQLGTEAQTLAAPTAKLTSKAVDGMTKLTPGAEAAANASKMSGMGVAMAGVSGALNAYDMMENGVNAGNAMGLASSAVFIGTMNAWNPVGWALLAGSAAYSIFG